VGNHDSYSDIRVFQQPASKNGTCRSQTSQQSSRLRLQSNAVRYKRQRMPYGSSSISSPPRPWPFIFYWLNPPSLLVNIASAFGATNLTVVVGRRWPLRDCGR
jgi:hypothetical protein